MINYITPDSKESQELSSHMEINLMIVRGLHNYKKDVTSMVESERCLISEETLGGQYRQCIEYGYSKDMAAEVVVKNMFKGSWDFLRRPYWFFDLLKHESTYSPISTSEILHEAKFVTKFDCEELVLAIAIVIDSGTPAVHYRLTLGEATILSSKVNYVTTSANKEIPKGYVKFPFSSIYSGLVNIGAHKETLPMVNVVSNSSRVHGVKAKEYQDTFTVRAIEALDDEYRVTHRDVEYSVESRSIEFWRELLKSLRENGPLYRDYNTSTSCDHVLKISTSNHDVYLELIRSYITKELF